MKQHPLIFLVLLVFCACNNGGSDTNKNAAGNDSSTNQTKPAATTTLLAKYPLLGWARKSPVEIGCMLQGEFGYKDSIFNCSRTNYSNNGDPCKKTDEYYEGIRFPDELAAKVHPLIKEISLEFEHGSLREIAIAFKDSVATPTVQQIFALPVSPAKLPDNVIEINYGDNVVSKEKPADINFTRWLTITGFEHIGAAEAGCN